MPTQRRETAKESKLTNVTNRLRMFQGERKDRKCNQALIRDFRSAFKTLSSEPEYVDGVVPVDVAISSFIEKYGKYKREDVNECLEKVTISTNPQRLYNITGTTPNQNMSINMSVTDEAFMKMTDVVEGNEGGGDEGGGHEYEDFDKTLENTKVSALENQQVAENNAKSAANTLGLANELSRQVVQYKAQINEKNIRLVDAIKKSNATLQTVDEAMRAMTLNVNEQMGENETALNPINTSAKFIKVNAFSTMGISNEYNLDGRPSSYGNFL